MNPIFSVGHSSLAWSEFLPLLKNADVGVLIDVRSRPISRWNHFSRAPLRARLNANGIAYVWLGAELGGRNQAGAILDYEQVAKTAAFRTGIEKCEEISGRARTALMCSEHEPCECHRFLLVSRHLAARGHSLQHILRDGRIEEQTATEDRLLSITRQTEADLLASRADRLDRAYRAQAHRIARRAR